MRDLLHRRFTSGFALFAAAAAVAALVMVAAAATLTYRMAQTSGIVVAQFLQPGHGARVE